MTAIRSAVRQIGRPRAFRMAAHRGEPAAAETITDGRQFRGKSAGAAPRRRDDDGCRGDVDLMGQAR